MRCLLFCDVGSGYAERRSELRAAHLTLAWEAEAKGELIVGGAFVQALRFRCGEALGAPPAAHRLDETDARGEAPGEDSERGSFAVQFSRLEHDDGEVAGGPGPVLIVGN